MPRQSGGYNKRLTHTIPSLSSRTKYTQQFLQRLHFKIQHLVSIQNIQSAYDTIIIQQKKTKYTFYRTIKHIFYNTTKGCSCFAGQTLIASHHPRFFCH